MARAAGAKRVFFASAAPPVRYPHVYGINMPTRAELIASARSIEEVASVIGADRVIYTTVEDLTEAIVAGSDIQQLDLSCFTGEYVTGTVTPEYLAWLESNQRS